MGDDERLLALASALADGAPLDWDREERSATGPERSVVSQLRLLAGLADVQRCQDFGHYTDLVLLGAGGSGEVYQARDTRLERAVALKFCARAGTLAEARLLAQVRHPHVVTVHGVETFDQRSAIVMELVEGRTLAEVIGEEGPLAEAEAARVAADVCRALAAVHLAGLVHGDVSARNVMCDAAGRVVLMDFGIGGAAGRLPEGRPRGTRPYMAPELLEGRPPTVASDVYAVGALLLHLRTGRAPSAAAAAAAAAAGRPPVGAGALEPVIRRALSPAPGDRFPDASAMERALRRGGRLRTVRRAGWVIGGVAALGLLAWARPAGRGVGLVPEATVPVAGRTTSPATPSVGPVTTTPRERTAARQVEPFVPPLGTEGPRGEPLPGGLPEAGLVAIHATLVDGAVELRASQALSLYVVREGEDATTLLFPLPGGRPRNPLAAGLTHRIPVHGPAEGVLLLAGGERLAAFEDRVAALRVPRTGPVREVPLPPTVAALLREGLGLVEPGRLLGRAPPLSGRLEIVRRPWMRRLGPAD